MHCQKKKYIKLQIKRPLLKTLKFHNQYRYFILLAILYIICIFCTSLLMINYKNPRKPIIECNIIWVQIIYYVHNTFSFGFQVMLKKIFLVFNPGPHLKKYPPLSYQLVDATIDDVLFFCLSKTTNVCLSLIHFVITYW